MIYGVGTPSKIRQAGTMYTDKRTGIIYIQNASPSGNAWSPLDNDVTDDSTGGPGGFFTGGTVVGATNFISTISSGGTNLYSIFALSAHTHFISDVNSLQDELNQKAPLFSPDFLENVTISGDESSLEVSGNITGETIQATYQLITNGLIVNVKNITESADYNVLDTDCAFFILATVTVKLPPSPQNGKILYFKMSSAGGRTLTIDGNTKTIDGASSTSLSSARQTITIMYNATQSDWMVL